MTLGWYAGRPCRSTCPTRRMFFCSPLWLMPSLSCASALLAPDTRTAAAADMAKRMVPFILHEARMVVSFGISNVCERADRRVASEASGGPRGRIPKTCAASALRLLSGAIGVRRQSRDPVKERREMALVRAAHGERHLDDRQIGRVEQFLGPFDAAADHVLVRCNANREPEHVREVVRADPKRLGDVREREVAIEVTVDECERLLDPRPRLRSRCPCASLAPRARTVGAVRVELLGHARRTRKKLQEHTHPPRSEGRHGGVRLDKTRIFCWFPRARARTSDPR